MDTDSDLREERQAVVRRLLDAYFGRAAQPARQVDYRHCDGAEAGPTSQLPEGTADAVFILRLA